MNIIILWPWQVRLVLTVTSVLYAHSAPEHLQPWERAKLKSTFIFAFKKMLSSFYSREKNTFFSLQMFTVAHSVQYLENTILDKNVKKNARYMFNFRILPSKARFTQDTPPSPPKKQCWSVARTFLQPTKQHWPGRGGGRGHHGAKYAGWVSCV